MRNGRIGQLKRIIALVAEQNAVDPGPGWKPMPVPEGFDYEMWLGPAPKAPYHKGRCFYRFRFNLDYSGGQTTNFGAHSINVGQWAMGTDLTGPIELEDLGSVWPPKGGLYNTATKVHFRALYANGVELECVTRDPGFGTRLEGTEGWVEYGYKGLQASSDSIKSSPIGPNDIHLPASNPTRTQEAGKYHIPDHVRNFLDCVEIAAGPGSGGRGRPPHGEHLPLGQHRHAAQAEAPLGPGQGAIHRRRRSQPDAQPPHAGTVATLNGSPRRHGGHGERQGMARDSMVNPSG